MKHLLAIPLLLLLLLLQGSRAFSQVGHAHGSTAKLGTALMVAKVPFLGRFRGKRKSGGKSTPISIGAPIPDIDVEMLTTGDDETIAVPVSMKEAVGDGKTVLVGMPGAFTSTCHAIHLPGYIKAEPKLKELGVDKIAVVTTNDRFVNEQWSKESGVKSEAVTMLCDADGDFVKEIGLAEDMGFGLGVRAKRFALVLNDGEVEKVFTDEGMDDCSATSAANVVQSLAPAGVAMEEEVDPKVLAVAALAAVAGAYYLYYN